MREPQEEQWALFMGASGIHDLRIQMVKKWTPERLYWGARSWTVAHSVVGIFPSFEAADDARSNARRAYENAYLSPWRNALNSPLAAARQAINATPGYQPAVQGEGSL